MIHYVFEKRDLEEDQLESSGFTSNRSMRISEQGAEDQCGRFSPDIGSGLETHADLISSHPFHGDELGTGIGSVLTFIETKEL